MYNNATMERNNSCTWYIIAATFHSENPTVDGYFSYFHILKSGAHVIIAKDRVKTKIDGDKDFRDIFDKPQPILEG